ncbi:uncharacterized protein DFL_001574 [Arthrobotrys flagrans]|uniref:Uncharacterized protein n=1 Tax=Arthrobotrys flagrans TaxID=97331 RepID=A0A437A7Z3_ARTFL|nr:hypothetical protein DFL_001574 [Arthrobotrys flagrans]
MQKPSVDSTSHPRLSLSSNAFGLNRPAAPPVGRRQLRLANLAHEPPPAVAEEQVQPQLLNQPEVATIDTAEEMPAQVSAPLLETDEPVDVIEPVVLEPEEEKVQTVNEISQEVVHNEREWSVVGPRVRGGRRRQGAQTNQAPATQERIAQ